jgi:hypothetical protein
LACDDCFELAPIGSEVWFVLRKVHIDKFW